MSEGKNGLAAALDATGTGALPAEAEQLSLLPEPALPEPARTASPRGGRPAGSRNKRTQDWVDLILGQYRSPLVFLASVFNRTPQQLAADAGLYMWHEGKPVLDAAGNHVLATGDALRLQVAAAKELAPYLHQKLPIALDVKGKTAGVILIGELPAEGSDQAAALSLFMPGEAEGDSEENQALIGSQTEKSDGSEVGNQPK